MNDVLPWRHASTDPMRSRRIMAGIDRSVRRRVLWRRLKRMALPLSGAVLLALYLGIYVLIMWRLFYAER